MQPSRVTQTLAVVRSRIDHACAASGRKAGDVTICAITKGFGPDAIDAALDAGLTNVGENYFQEAAEKFAAISWRTGVVRHFVGRVQRNKARRIAELFDVVQTLEDLTIARALNDGAAAQHKALDVLVQVNVSDDQRQGVAPDELSDFVSALGAFPNLHVHGLMAVGPRNPDETAAAFARARASFDQLHALSPAFDTLSMGMSDDLELAIAADSTMLRLGTALFGSRAPK